MHTLDACALIALFKNEKGSEKIEALFTEALKGQTVVFMSIVNLIEVHYGFCQTLGKEKADLILEQIHTMPIHFIDTINEAIFSETSRLKTQYGIPLGDAIGLATAIDMKSIFVTSDHSDFSQIEKAESISFFWFR